MEYDVCYMLYVIWYQATWWLYQVFTKSKHAGFSSYSCQINRFFFNIKDGLSIGYSVSRLILWFNVRMYTIYNYKHAKFLSQYIEIVKHLIFSLCSGKNMAFLYFYKFYNQIKVSIFSFYSHEIDGSSIKNSKIC